MNTRLSLRAKVLLVSTVLLVIPYVGYRYVQEMENFLRSGLEASVLGAAQAIAGALHDRADLLAEYAAGSDDTDDEIFVYPLAQAMQMDGYVSDWRGYRDRLQAPPRANPDLDFGFRYLVGEHGDYVYALIEVNDRDLRYRSPSSLGARGADRVDILMGNFPATPKRYRMSPIAPGWVSVYGITSARDNAPLRTREPRIWAQWRSTSVGYTIELRIPKSLTGRRMAIEVFDAGDAGGRRLSTSISGAGDRPGRLIFPSSDIAGIIHSLGRTPGRRIRVVDAKGRVLAGGGSLKKDAAPEPVNPLFALLLPPPSAELLEDESGAGVVGGTEVALALKGESASRWHGTENPGIFIVTAAHPVWVGEQVAAAVLVEETSAGIQTVRRQALADLFNKTLMVFTGAGLLLFLFANRISFRLRRLRDDAEGAIDDHGRVVGRIRGSRSRDEIGDLGRSFSALMERLRQYNHYLEHLARRLSHELRTPLAVIRSSLETLAMGNKNPEDEKYIQRAQDGLARLETIIVRMSEATRLEEALQSAEPIIFDLADVVAASVDGYRQTWPELNIDYSEPKGPCRITGVPDLVVQLMDKLVGNAREFTPAGGQIRISLGFERSRPVLKVANDGPTLPAEMSEKIFDSMVSLREKSDGISPHLGLGLYIVRLIAEFHGGTVRARNLESMDGVEFCVTFGPVAAARGPARNATNPRD